eukprot:gene4026-biopygen2502
MILCLADEDKPRTAEHIDNIISAEIQDENTHVREHHIVKKHMMHGPCGILNPSWICMQEEKCSKKFAQQTELDVHGYPLYRRVCTTIKSVKNIFKYIHKGNDMAHVEIREGHKQADPQHNIAHDEIHQYLNSRYVGPHQAVYKLMQYEMYDKSHTIVRLAIHLPDQHAVYFTDPEQAAHRNNDSMLMAYFTLNQKEQNAHQIPRRHGRRLPETQSAAGSKCNIPAATHPHVPGRHPEKPAHSPRNPSRISLNCRSYLSIMLSHNSQLTKSTSNTNESRDSKCFQQLNPEQLQIHNAVLHAIEAQSTNNSTALKAVDRLLRDITKVNRPFGGKYFMLGVVSDKYCQSSRKQAENE